MKGSRSDLTVRTLLAIVFAGALSQAFDTPRGNRQLAVTVDDLPMQGTCRDNAAAAINKALLSTFRQYRIPAAGFVNESKPCKGLRQYLEQWALAGMDLGNHTYSHPDLNRIAWQEYAADISRGEPITREILKSHGKALRYFRHPFLHAGSDEIRKREIDRYLADHGYEIAPVTLDNQEWVFSGAYDQSLLRGDTGAVKRIRTEYVSYMVENIRFFEGRSREVLGREPAQILLIHANRLNADAFGELAWRLAKRGYEFVSLGAALKDSAYRLPDKYVGPKGLSWIHRWGLAKGMPVVEEPREPEWLHKILRAN